MDLAFDRARAVLAAHFGYPAFRPGQADVIREVLRGRDTLAVLPTGGGKSLCYQVPALMLPGLTVVVSPLISLMKDQVDQLRARGLPATLVNSTLGAAEVSHRLAGVARGDFRLLYVAPERCESPDLQRALARCVISLLAVDEAHCISEWGHEFRPSYRRIARIMAGFGRPQTVALTATATPAVRQDITRQLAMRRPAVVVGGFDRPNLRYAVRSCRNDADKELALLHAVQSARGAAIVYAATRSAVERLARRLARAGYRALPYHAGLGEDRRRDAQERFMTGALDVIVATNAFGMGIDKPDVRLVVHHAMPGSLEAYYQEAGRAGRDGAESRCVLLHAYRDRFTHEYFVRGMFPTKDIVERVATALRAFGPADAVPDDPAALARRCALSSRDVGAALRFLREQGIVRGDAPDRARVCVRLLATPERIRQELPAESLETGLLRALWRMAGRRLERGVVVDVGELPPGLAGRTATQALAWLRDRQFVTIEHAAGGSWVPRGVSLDQIDWSGMHRRRDAELAKLDAMQRYAYARDCRRAHVLRYFGEQPAAPRCAGCDNCPGQRLA